jgi:hypothetical protein
VKGREQTKRCRGGGCRRRAKAGVWSPRGTDRPQQVRREGRERRGPPERAVGPLECRARLRPGESQSRRTQSAARQRGGLPRRKVSSTQEPPDHQCQKSEPSPPITRLSASRRQLWSVRLWPLPQPAESCFSSPRCVVNSASRARSTRALVRCFSSPFSPTLSAGFGSFVNRLSMTSWSISLGSSPSLFRGEQPFTQFFLHPHLCFIIFS